MAKARAIVKRRKAVRNIKKITKTMQMIATAKFQKSLRRAVSTKPYTLKVRELVAELAQSVGDADHPLLRRGEGTGRAAVVVITSNRGLCGAYNGSVLRKAQAFIRGLTRDQVPFDLYCAGKRGASFFRFQKVTVADVIKVSDTPHYNEVEPYADQFIERFITGSIRSLHIASMNFISTGVQRAEIMTLLPLAGLQGAADRLGQDIAELDAQIDAGSMDTKRTGDSVRSGAVQVEHGAVYEFKPDPRSLLDELLPLTIKTAFFQAFLDASTSEHVSRMVAMKSATDNADKMAKALTLQYNRARQSQITTELSEIMGGVESMES
jgi:F-type H+-transporting ATPase subunit gamma